MSKMSTKLIYLILVLATLSSCSIARPISKDKPKNNVTYEVEYLFEHEGCKVYRFLDNSNYIYFTNCMNTASYITGDSTKIRVQGMNSK